MDMHMHMEIRERVLQSLRRYKQNEATAEDHAILNMYLVIKKHHDEDWSVIGEQKLMDAALEFAKPPADYLGQQAEDFIAWRREMYHDMLRLATEQKLLKMLR